MSGTTTGGTIDQSGGGLLKFLNFATPGGAKTLTLQGSTAGTGEIAGAIVDNSTTNTTGLIKTGTGTWTLSGTNAYTGTTAINGGNLVLASTGTLNNTAVSINNTGTFSPIAGTTIGNNTAAKGATVTINPGGTLNLADGTTGTFTIAGGTGAPTAATFAGGTLAFDLGTSAGANDSLVLTVNGVAGSGVTGGTSGNAIVINPIGSSLTPGTYDLIKAGSGLVNSNFYLGTPNLTVGGQLYTLTLGLDGTFEAVTVTTNGGSPATPASAYWTGSQNTGSWATQVSGNTNFAAGATGTPNTARTAGCGHECHVHGQYGDHAQHDARRGL